MTENEKYKEIVDLQSNISSLSVEDSITLTSLIFTGGRMDCILHLLKVLKKIDDGFVYRDINDTYNLKW